MSKLVQLKQHQQAHCVHERCIKLEINNCRTDMIAGTQKSLSNRGSTQSIVYASIKRNSTLNSIPVIISVIGCFIVKIVTDVDNYIERNSKNNVSNIAEDMAKVLQANGCVQTLKVVVAKIKIT